MLVEFIEDEYFFFSSAIPAMSRASGVRIIINYYGMPIIINPILLMPRHSVRIRWYTIAETP